MAPAKRPAKKIPLKKPYLAKAKVVTVPVEKPCDFVEKTRKPILAGLDAEQLRELVKDAQKHLEEFDKKGSKQRLKDFNGSKFKADLISEIEDLRKRSQKKLTEKFQFCVELTVVATINESEILERVYDESTYDDLFEKNVICKVTGKLTQQQSRLLKEAVDEFILDMCDDGYKAFFPTVQGQIDQLDEELTEMHNRLWDEIQARKLELDDIDLKAKR